jgi:DNA recombination protein RmuC
MDSSTIAVISLIIAAISLAMCIYVVRVARKPRQGIDALFKNLATKDDVRTLHDDNERVRSATERQAKESREEVAQRLDSVRDSMVNSFTAFTESQIKQWDTMGQRIENMSTKNADRLETIRNTVDKQLQTLQNNNEKKLDEMRGVVDEKLTKTLDNRLGQSFKQVSEQLEQVYKSLGGSKNPFKGYGRHQKHI